MPPQTNTQKKIILVDDDKFLLDMYALKFTKAGYDVKACDTSESALKLLQGGFVPDIMLVDIVMPQMDGLELIGKIRDQKLAQGTTIIMLTNQGTSDDLDRAKQARVDGYIVKATTIPSEVFVETEKIYSEKNKK